jgi:hypothetical protein
MQNLAARSVDTDPFETGDLNRDYGLVTGRVVQFAEALDCTPSELVDAVEGGVRPFVDTAKQNPDTESTYDRPDDPEKRCMAFLEEDFRRLAAEIGAREAIEGEAIPAEIG